MSFMMCPISSDKFEDARRHWGGGKRGNKSTEKMNKRAKALGMTIAGIGKA